MEEITLKDFLSFSKRNKSVMIEETDVGGERNFDKIEYFNSFPVCDIFVFRKPTVKKDLKKHKFSIKWWENSKYEYLGLSSFENCQEEFSVHFGSIQFQ